MNKELKPILKFNNEQEEREFWQNNDSTEYIDYAQVQSAIFPNLKLTSKPITIRLPQTLIDQLKIKAHKMDVPYQSLIKKLILDEVSK